MMFKKTPALFAIWILLVATFGPIGLVSADSVTGCDITKCGALLNTNCAKINQECVASKGGYYCQDTGVCDAPIMKTSSGVFKLSEDYKSKNAICFNPSEGTIPFSEKTDNSICVACSDES